MNSSEKLNKAAAKSILAGKTVGKLLFASNPGWSRADLNNYVHAHRPVPGMVMDYYKQGLMDGYLIARKQRLARIKGYTQYSTPTVEEAMRLYDEGGNQLPPQGEK